MDYFMTFLEGIASFISPCVLPLIPIYISYFAGKEEKKTSKAVINSIGFVLGFTIVYTILAIISNRVGNVLYNYLSYIRVVFGVLSIILGFIYMDVIKFNIFNKFKKHDMNLDNLNFIKTILFGVLFAISMTPCVGLFLSSALLLIASEVSFYKGLILILLYSLGFGIPFILSSFLIDRFKNTFDFIKKHFNVVKIISGIILIVMGLYIIFIYR